MMTKAEWDALVKSQSMYTTSMYVDGKSYSWKDLTDYVESIERRVVTLAFALADKIEKSEVK